MARGSDDPDGLAGAFEHAENGLYLLCRMFGAERAAQQRHRRLTLKSETMNFAPSLGMKAVRISSESTVGTET